MSRRKNNCAGVNRLFLLIMCSMIFVPLAAARFLTPADIDIYDSTVFSAYLYLIPVLLYVAVTRGRCVEDIPFSPLRPGTILLIILFSILLLPVVTWINMFSMMFSENYVSQEMESAVAEPFLKNMIFLAVIPAVLEEYSVRGVLFHGYRRAGILKGAVVSGVLFGLMHRNFNQFCYAAALGVIFALLVEATGSIFASMIAHFTINMNSVIIIELESSIVMNSGAGNQTQTTLSGAEYMIMWAYDTVIAVIFGLMAFGVFVWITRRSRRKEHMCEILHPGEARNEENSSRILTPSLAAGVFICIVYMIILEFV
ncbi:MAG: type II CAAX endopeptidase family protein [Lachnospiraceae bacterium]|nr:type II CAAX endopeptidase family protein [Lachnospiraceae bacterium]